jgi:hypothetical protein
MVPKPTALLCGCSLWPGDDPHDTFSSSPTNNARRADNDDELFDATAKEPWKEILDRQTIENEISMPSLRPFRKSESSRKGEVSGDETQQPRKGSMRGLFGKKKKDKNSDAIDTATDPAVIDALPEELAPVAPVLVEKEEIPGPTEHTVTSVGSDVTSEASDEEVAPSLQEEEGKKQMVVLKEGLTKQEINFMEPPRDETPAEVIQEPLKAEISAGDDVAACYLVYEPDSSGRLVEHYSKTPVEGAVGRWVASGDKKIAGFKFTRNAGRNVLIGSCSAGVQGRRNYCNGWCQFVKSCKILKGNVTVWDVPKGFKAMPADLYLYYDDARPNHQTIKLEPGIAYTTDKLLAVACLPKSSPFFENNITVDIMKWLQDARDYGYSTKI